MSLTGLVIRHHGDSFLKLRYYMSCTGPGEIIDRTEVVDNLVNIRIKWKTSIHENKLRVYSSFSASKYSVAMDHKIKINMRCDYVSYIIKGFKVPEQWSEWIEMGFVEAVKQEHVYATTFDIYITTFKVNEDQLCPKLYSDEQFTDFKLSAADGTVAVHRACLATLSEVFKAMLNGESKETAEGQIKIGTVSVQTLQQLKDYLYLGTVPDEGLGSLLLIARCYQIEDLAKQCIRKLAETVLPEDLFSLLEFACVNLIPELSFAILQITRDSVIDKAHQIRNDETKK